MSLFHKTAEDSKDDDAFVYSFKIKGSRTFIIEKDTFEIEEFWVSHMAYSTTYRFKTEVKRDSYKLNLKITNSKTFVRNYTTNPIRNRNADYLFKLHFKNNQEYDFYGITGTNELKILQLSLEKDTFEDLLAEEDKYICLYKDTIPVKKFKLVN